ncbi:ATP-binding protein, partial [Klebsiella quasipneumoniae]|uniref:ATP-binding protein n=1 Tax=Klebsiella quasipneumoniae TaxID=1463165 RepID=UPI00358DB6AE|nr:hypothetical protein [Klebsiella quasipneumoniae]
MKVKSDIFVETDINIFIANELHKYKSEIPKKYSFLPLELIQGVDGSDYLVKILPTEMSSVLFSLLNNSIDSLYEKSLLDADFIPKLTVETCFYNDFVEIRIQDNGKGISEGEKTQLFSPFFTTKPT